MIVAQEVQKTMHHKMGKMVCEWQAFVGGLARGRLVGNHDIAQEHGAREWRRCVAPARPRRRKGQYVGRPVATAPVAIELADCRIVGKHDGKLANGRAINRARRGGLRDGATERRFDADRGFPQHRFHNDVDRRARRRNAARRGDHSWPSRLRKDAVAALS